MSNMTMKEIKEKMSTLQDQVQVLNGEIEELENLKASLKTKKFKEIVQGTSWTLERRRPELWYSGGSKRNKTHKDEELENYIFKDLELYPHGSAFISENIKVSCNDGTIILRVDITEKMHKEASKTASYKVDSYGDMQYKVLFNYAKEHNIAISLEEEENGIRQAEESLQQDKEQLVHVIELMDQ